MINFRVADLDAMIAQLVAAGAMVHDNRSEASFGKFVHVSDPEGNRFELWEPAVIPAPGELDGL
jgi:predicted enzyme related to lactoylglutathione lyase